MRLSYYYLIIISLLVLITGSAFPSYAAEKPDQVIKRHQMRIDKLLGRKVKPGSEDEKRIKAEMKTVVNDLLDYRELAKQALGKHWQKRTEKDREEFVNILRELIEHNYVKQLKTNLGYHIEYRPTKITGDTALVFTVIQVKKNGRTTALSIDYKMRKGNQGWKVYDVITDEVSLVNNYRSQFNRIINRESYEALVKKMRRKLEEIS